jgi:proteasome lid subunit RPN8/RPN11
MNKTTTAAYLAPDVRELRDRELSQVPFPGGGGQDLRVYLSPAVYDSLSAHAAEDTSVEICGVLVGTWARDAGGAFVRITDAIRGEAARNKFAEVTFTHDTWARINEEMDKRFADSAIVGWYHTHPDFGVFLSDRDRFIHEHFFSGPGQIALVIDPIRKTIGAFAWRDGKPVLCPHVWVGDRVVVGTAAGEEAPPAPPAERAAAAQVAGAGPREPSHLPLLTQVLAYLAVFLLGNLMSGCRNSWEQARLAEGAVAHYGVWKGMRPGLHEGLDAVRGRIETLNGRINRLAAEDVKIAQAQKGAQDQIAKWVEVDRDLGEVARFVGELDRLFSLSPDETNAVGKLVLESLRSLGETRSAAGNPDLPAAAAPKGPTGEVSPAPAGGSPKADSATPAAEPAESRPREPSK